MIRPEPKLERINLDELDRLCVAATQGDWWWSDDALEAGASRWDRIVLGADPVGYQNSSVRGSEEDKAYIAATDPRTVHGLIAYIRELETALKRAVDLALNIESPRGTPYQPDRECYRGSLGEYRAVAERGAVRR